MRCKPCKPRSPRLAAAACLAALAAALTGCTPSIRFTSEQRPAAPPTAKEAGGPAVYPSAYPAEETAKPAAYPAQEAAKPAAYAENDPNQWYPLTQTSAEEDTKPLVPQPLTPDPTAARKGSYKLLEEVVNSYVGVPYKWGGSSRNGFDCSGFVITVYREVYEAGLPRSSSAMWASGRKIPINAAKPGDLVFFKGGSFGTVDHVGIYMGHNRFVHASTSSGVIYSDLKETYYARRFVGARRLI